MSFIGDSLQAQFVNRLVNMMRGEGVIKSNELRDVDLRVLIENVAKQVAEQGTTWDAGKLAGLLEIDQVDAITHEVYEAHESAITTALSLLDQAHIYLEHTGDKQAQISMTHLYEKLLVGCGTIIKTLGIAELFQPSDGDMEANYKGHKLLFLLHCYSVLSQIAIPLLGLKWGGIVVGSFFVMVMILSLVYPLIAPPPTHIPEGKNWTELAQRGLLESVEGRQWEVEEILRILRLGKAPLLTGPTGVGKTEAIKELVRYHELQGTRVFVINAASLPHSCGMFSRKQVLAKIREAIGSHREKVIVVLDELGALFRTSHGEQAAHAKDIVQQLKSSLDPGPEGFQIIGITTEGEYKRYILMEGSDDQAPDHAFIRRFERIQVESTNPEVTGTILKMRLLHKAPQVVVEEGAINYLVQKVAEEYQGKVVEPKGSLTLLTACLDRLSRKHKSDEYRAVEQKRSELRALNVTAAMSLGRAAFPSNEDLEHKKVLKEELQELEATLKVHQDEAKKLHRCEKQLQQATRAFYHSALKVAKLNPGDHIKEQKAFLLNGFFYCPALVNHLSEKGTVLNKALIDEVFGEVDLTSHQVAMASDSDSCGSHCSHHHVQN